MKNATQITMLKETSTSFLSATTSAFQAITRGAIYAKVSEAAGVKSGTIKEALIKSLMDNGLKNSTAQNYTSRCLTVAAFFRWTLDDTLTFAANAEAIFPQVAALWGEL